MGARLSFSGQTNGEKLSGIGLEQAIAWTEGKNNRVGFPSATLRNAVEDVLRRVS
jgi:hypothetical protein